MKKFVVISLTILLVVTMLVGCASPQPSAESTVKPMAEQAPLEEPATATAKTQEQKTYRIANLVKQLGTAWYARQELGLDVMNEEGGVECFMVGPETADPALQVQIMEDLIAQGVDAITVVPISVEVMEPVCKKAREAGIVVISHEAAGMKNVDYDVEAFDNAAYGAFMMDQLALAMEAKGDYATMVGFLTSKSHNEWMDAAVARQKEAYPEMNLAADKIEENDDSKKGYEKTRELIKTYPGLKGILGGSMSGTQGVGLAIEEMGVQDKVSAHGTCIVSVAGPFLESGALKSASFWDPAGAGYALNKIALMVLQGKEGEIKAGTNLGYSGYDSIAVDGNVVYGTDMILATKDNMGDYPY